MAQTWRREYGAEHASAHAAKILGAIGRDLERLGEGRSAVCSIRIGAGPGDLHDFEVELELAPGAILATRYQSVDEDDRDPDALEHEDGAVARQAVETAAEFTSRGIGRLAELLHELRVRTRQVIARWRVTGVDASLIDIRFVREEHWRDEDALAVEVRLLVIDERLKPAVRSRDVRSPELLEQELGRWHGALADRFAVRAALARLGADGIVDRLAANAIASRWDLGSALRGIARGDVYGHSQALTVFVEDGRVRCHGQTPDGALTWNRDTVSVFGTAIPATAATALKGKAITRLIQHPVLTDDMVIVEVRTSFEHDEHVIRARFTQPSLLFCSASGRTWAATGLGAGKTATV